MPSSMADPILQRPTLAWLLSGVAVVLIAYTIFVRQEIFLLVWFGLSAFVVFLAYRFVRAVERIAAAIERSVEAEKAE